jgi:hypothetical protein
MPSAWTAIRPDLEEDLGRHARPDRALAPEPRRVMVALAHGVEALDAATTVRAAVA